MKSRTPAFRPLAKFKVVSAEAQHVLLAGGGIAAEIIVLAENLFRVRILRGPFKPAAPSWAVIKTEWDLSPARVVKSATQVRIETMRATLIFSLRDGKIRFTDRAGSERFTSIPEATGFEGDKARIAFELAPLGSEFLYGLGETTGPMNKRGLIRELWNTDVLGHAPAVHPGLRTLYASIPFLTSLRLGMPSGLFFDNPARQVWDLGQTQVNELKIEAASGELDLYFFTADQPSEITERYAELTGHTPMPPRWGLGYHQCRYSYETAARLEQVAGEFRKRKIPCDALYLDIHHMDGYRVFTFGKTYPKPEGLIARLAKMGFKTVTIVDPGVKEDRKFPVFQRGVKADVFVKDPSGNHDFKGRVWPGEARFPDFTNRQVRAWWGREQAALMRAGVAGFWNDMNEPANFALPTKTLDEKCLHHSDHGEMRHAEAHNLYGMMMARASREGALTERPNERPFVITRAGYAGIQRYALVWTGDNSSVWEHMADSLQMCLNLGLSGVPFCGSDIGGFLDNTTPELLLRWTQMAAFTPFFRNHSNLGTIDQEPWAFGPEWESALREAISLRYQFLPLFYCLFAQAHARGTPIVRPLFYHYPHDPIAARVEDQFMLGPDVMVAPVLRPGATARSVYLPEGVWYDLRGQTPIQGPVHHLRALDLDHIPVYIRAGGILPLGRPRQFIDGKPDSEIALHIWAGGRGKLEWYEDDGSSNNHEQGEFHRRLILAAGTSARGSVEFGPSAGIYPSGVRDWNILIHLNENPKRIRAGGAAVPFEYIQEQGVVLFRVANSNTPFSVVWG